MKKIIFLFLFLSQVAQAQITVSTIILSGNAKTQDDIIIRELSFEKNISYATGDLDKRIEKSKENLINLKLFNFVTINKTENKDSTAITI
ncbi:MAG: POTRA domain-containing protein, partial [Flavobacteriales bacterium]